MTIAGLHYVRMKLAGGAIRWFVYAWRGGPRIMVADGARKPSLSEAAIDEYRRARLSASRDTFGEMVQAYRQSREWHGLAESTRRNWRAILDIAEERWGASPIKLWSDPRMVPKVIKWRDEAAATPRTADYRVGVLHSLLAWGRLNAFVTVNVATGIPQLYKGGSRAEIIWLAEDLERFAAVANQAVNDAVRLACHSGLRLADLAALTWAEVGEHAIVRLAAKASKGKRRKATVPITPDLRALLAELKARQRAKGVDTVLVTSEGAAWSGPGLGKRVGEFRDRAGIVHTDGRTKHLHDCRGTFATHLIEAGLTDQEVAGVLAWAPERVANIRATYVDGARTIVALAERIAARPVK